MRHDGPSEEYPQSGKTCAAGLIYQSWTLVGFALAPLAGNWPLLDDGDEVRLGHPS